jgi:hypothetical protein
MARARRTSCSEVGVSDLFLGGFSSARSSSCLEFVFSSDGFLATLAQFAAVNV